MNNNETNNASRWVTDHSDDTSDDTNDDIISDDPFDELVDSTLGYKSEDEDPTKLILSPSAKRRNRRRKMMVGNEGVRETTNSSHFI